MLYAYLRLQKAELEERLAEEEEIEKSWQLEFEEISNFSQTSDEKYEAYTQVFIITAQLKFNVLYIACKYFFICSIYTF